MRRRLRNERGAVLPLVAVTLIGLLGVAALVIDGGLMFAERRDLQALADSAARAGAMALDVDALRADGRVVLDPTEAQRDARDFLRAAGFSDRVRVTADTSEVTVDLSQERSTILMGLLGVRQVRTEAHAVGRPRAGVDRPEGSP